MGLFGAIVGAVCSLASGIMGALSGLEISLPGLGVLAGAFLALGKVLGLIKPETQPEDFGDQVIQAEEAGIKPENFNSYAEYMKKVEEFKVDPEKSKLIPEEDKLKKGIAVTSALAAEKYPDFPMEAFANFVFVNPQYFTADRMTEFGKLISGNIDRAMTVFGYMNGTERNGNKLESAQNTLLNIEKTVNPNISDSDALKNVLSARK